MFWNRRKAPDHCVDGPLPDDLAEVARKLRPAQVQGEEHREAVLKQLMQTVEKANAGPDAETCPTEPADTCATTTHTRQVGHPQMGTLTMADIEPIDPARIARVTAQIEALELERESETPR